MRRCRESWLLTAATGVVCCSTITEAWSSCNSAHFFSQSTTTRRRPYSPISNHCPSFSPFSTSSSRLYVSADLERSSSSTDEEKDVVNFIEYPSSTSAVVNVYVPSSTREEDNDDVLSLEQIDESDSKNFFRPIKMKFLTGPLRLFSRKQQQPFLYAGGTNSTEMNSAVDVRSALSPTDAIFPSTSIAVDEVVADFLSEEQSTTKSTLMNKIQDKIGTVSNDRYIFPEYNSGEIPRLFSSLEYHYQAVEEEEGTSQNNSNNKRVIVSATHAAGSVVAAASLIAGTTVGAGVLALPAATASAGFLPSTVALLIGYGYMTVSGLLIAELTLNRMGQTGKPAGLLGLYESSLGQPYAALGSVAYFFLHYAVMVAYMAQGGINLASVLPAAEGLGPLAFGAVLATALWTANKPTMDRVNNGLVLGVFATFAAILALGAGTADFAALIDPVNQHPENVVDGFPVIFLAFVYQNVVPVIVKDLEGDRSKIIKAVIAGTTVPLFMFLAWNAVILGNVAVAGGDVSLVDPVALLQSSSGGVGAQQLLAPLVTAFSTLAIATSIIGFTYGLIDAWTDVLKIDKNSVSAQTQWKLPLFGIVFVPPLALAMAYPDIFMTALEYGGAFGVSTLFLVLPPLMVWNERYGDHKPDLVTRPMVPLGKIPLGSMWKAAATLILEQGAEKLGVFDWMQNYIS